MFSPHAALFIKITSRYGEFLFARFRRQIFDIRPFSLSHLHIAIAPQVVMFPNLIFFSFKFKCITENNRPKLRALMLSVKFKYAQWNIFAHKFGVPRNLHDSEWFWQGIWKFVSVYGRNIQNCSQRSISFQGWPFLWVLACESQRKNNLKRGN